MARGEVAWPEVQDIDSKRLMLWLQTHDAVPKTIMRCPPLYCSNFCAVHHPLRGAARRAFSQEMHRRSSLEKAPL
jgi:hypothetical protein